MRRIVCAAFAAAIALLSLAARAEETSPAARGGEVDVRAIPDQLNLGEDVEARVEVVLPKGAKRVRLKAAVGKVRDVTVESGKATGTYRPPDSFMPCVDVIIAIVELRDGTKVGFAAIRLTGQGEAVLKTRAKAQARIRIGDREYGPVQADKHGQARIQIRVPPGTSVGYDERGGAVELGVPPTPRVALFPERPKGTMAIPVYVVATRIDGGRDEASAVALSVDRGEISEPRALGGGVLVATYTPPAGEGGRAVITAAVEGEELPAATATVKLAASAKAAAMDAATGSAAPPKGAHRIDLALKLGFASNLGAINAFDAGADLAYELPLAGVGLRLGGGAGFTASRTDERVAMDGDETARATAMSWLVPIVGILGCRFPLSSEWSLTASAEGGAAMLDNVIRVRAAGEDAGAEHERLWLPFVGGAAEVAWELGPGAIVAEVRYLHAFRQPETVSGRLATLHVDVGYRFIFEP